MAIDTKKNFKRVGTHDGRFHADEVMATAILKKVFEIEIIRTRDPQKLGELDIVYDVGGGDFDHHGIEKVYRDDGIPFAACGLIWNRFGREVIIMEDPSLTKEEIESVFYYVDRFLIEGIDAQDNGVRIADEMIPSMNISTIISGYNPPWYSEKMEDKAFHKAVEAAIPILENTIKRRLAVIKARDIVVRAYENRERPEILVLDTYCPWEETVQEIDEEGEVVLVIHPDKDKYAVQTIRGQDGRTKKHLPKSWAGLENGKLAAITGVEDSVFCHTGRFIAIAESFEGIMRLAELAIYCSDEED